ncbi:380_t:CDS:2, partial [Dentiscutata heterogama]
MAPSLRQQYLSWGLLLTPYSSSPIVGTYRSHLFDSTYNVCTFSKYLYYRLKSQILSSSEYFYLLLSELHLYNEATKEDWKQYQEDLVKLTVDNRALTRCWTLSTPDKLNLIWDIIAGAIWRAADKNILKKKVSSSSNNRTRKCKPTKLHKSTVKLGKIIQMVKRFATDGDQSIDIEMLSKKIEQINNMHQADIPGLSCKIYEKETLYKWVCSAKVCWKAMRVQEKVEIDKATRKKIDATITQRYERIDGEVGLMLA